MEEMNKLITSEVAQHSLSNTLKLLSLPSLPSLPAFQLVWFLLYVMVS